ncbi:MAG: CopD family protein [Haloarculaceae archaeon]
MALIDAAMRVLHVAFAGIWTGSVLLVTVAVLPTAQTGTIGPDALAAVMDRFTSLSRLSVLVLLLTGGYMAGTSYTAETLLSQPSGHLVLTMLVLWFVLAALVEVGASRVSDGVSAQKVRTPAAEARPFFLAGAVVSLLLLVDAGLLASSV